MHHDAVAFEDVVDAECVSADNESSHRPFKDRRGEGLVEKLPETFIDDGVEVLRRFRIVFCKARKLPVEVPLGASKEDNFTRSGH